MSLNCSVDIHWVCGNGYMVHNITRCLTGSRRRLLRRLVQWKRPPARNQVVSINISYVCDVLSATFHDRNINHYNTHLLIIDLDSQVVNLYAGFLQLLDKVCLAKSMFPKIPIFLVAFLNPLDFNYCGNTVNVPRYFNSPGFSLELRLQESNKILEHQISSL